MLVHCDYTAESGPLRVEQLLGAEARDLLSRRVAFFNGKCCVAAPLPAPTQSVV